MKIYANTNNSTLEFLKQFIGTDIWVLCKHDDNLLHYIHISDIRNGYVYYEHIGERLLYTGDKTDYRSAYTTIVHFDSLWPAVSKPLTVLTTEEINEALNNLI